MLWKTYAPPDKTPRQAYYFNLESGELFTQQIGQFTPIRVAHAGAAPVHDPAGQGVRAYVFSCGDCGDADSRYIGWIEMHNPAYLGDNAKGGHGEMSPAFTMMMLAEREDGTLVRAVDRDDWLAKKSAEGKTLMADARDRCGDRPAVRCEP